MTGILESRGYKVSEPSGQDIILILYLIFSRVYEDEETPLWLRDQAEQTLKMLQRNN